jgi:hypothetical protein
VQLRDLFGETLDVRPAHCQPTHVDVLDHDDVVHCVHLLDVRCYYLQGSVYYVLRQELLVIVGANKQLGRLQLRVKTLNLTRFLNQTLVQMLNHLNRRQLMFQQQLHIQTLHMTAQLLHLLLTQLLHLAPNLRRRQHVRQHLHVECHLIL